MAIVEFDHLVVAAVRLADGIAHVERALGVACQPGGSHPAMGTHNALLRLGDGQYLEVIAIDPDAQAPRDARWFGLDDPAVQQRLAAHGPQLLTWVARTDDLDAAMQACRHDAGSVRAIRRGDLHWRVAFAADGRLVDDGLVPALMAWGEGTRHPSAKLPDRGLALESIDANHPAPGRVADRLAALGLADVLTLRESGLPGLVAKIVTPNGRVRLG